MVLNKFWFSKNNVNVFIIGEVHNIRNFNGTGTYEAFNEFMQDLQTIDTGPIDIMLEISDESIDRDSLPYNPEYYQITNIRNLLHHCIKTHSCGKLRVHWVDGDYSKHPYMISKRFSPTITIAEPKKTLRTALNAMPQWLKHFYENYQEVDGKLVLNLTPELIERFKTVQGILSLLDENTIVLKEIDKATHINPKFNLEFARDVLISELVLTNYDIFNAARTVMDIYTVARMIKSKMKNVIIYVGAAHSIRIANMLVKLDYTTEDEFPNSPEDADEIDYLTAIWDKV